MAASGGGKAGPAAESAAADALFGLSWSDPRFPPQELSAHNALHYFCQPGLNPFYDRTSNNERIKQMNHQIIDVERLELMTGKEYAVVYSQPPVLHLIQERDRVSKSVVTPRALFYMVQGVVYKCPDLGTLLHSKLATTMHHLQKSLDNAEAIKRFKPTEGYTWEDDIVAAAATAGKREAPSQDRRLHSKVAQLIAQMPCGTAQTHDGLKRRGEPAASPRGKKQK
eukprot:m.43898 g.43898  ORF g.43898 m.43898 type:complete len:225 (+) comp14863_c0_seq2:298-972(+)